MKTLEQQLSRIDLNLLVALSVLIHERNVSRAAEKLYLSQPAMSRTLKRLRDTFEDPLFYRESNGLQPTEKALQLQEPLLDILNSVQALINQTQFSPQNCDQTFKVSFPPLMSNILSVPVAKKLMQIAPQASLVEYAASFDPRTLLKNREVDFSVHIKNPAETEEFDSVLIGNSYPVFYVRREHPLVAKSEVTLDDCLSYNYVDLNLEIRSNQEFPNPIDTYLKSLGKQRVVSYKSAQIYNLIDAIIDSDSILVSNHAISSLEIAQNQLVPVFEITDVEELSLPIYLIEHKRTFNSPAHQWFKQMVFDALKDSALST